MTRDWIFVPVIVQVLLTLLIYVRLIKVKIREMKAGHVDMARPALHEEAWPASVLQINNNIRNQFELPVLFYVMASSCGRSTPCTGSRWRQPRCSC